MDLPAGVASKDSALVQIIDAALAEAARKSGAWLVCRPGCTQCCIGVFPITALDALRLRAGLEELAVHDPERAARVLERASAAAKRLSSDFPGDAASGVLGDDRESEERFATWADEEPCPALDPSSGRCDLYGARPITCRMFGPAVRPLGGALAVCELCYHGATASEIAACAATPDPEGLEDALLAELEAATGRRGQTIVAFALAAPRRP